jgi:hypothetical protein
VVPVGLTADLGKLIEYSTSCTPVFVQRAGIAALNEGEPVIGRTVACFRRARDLLVKELNAIDGVTADSLEFCKQLMREDRLAEGLRRLRHAMVHGRGRAPRVGALPFRWWHEKEENTYKSKH